MKYYFLPGRYFNLSKAELLSVIDQYAKDFKLTDTKESVIFVETDSDLTPLFNRLGGFLSFGVIIENLDTFLDKFNTYEKLVFGINVYAPWDLSEVSKLYNSIKTEFKNRGVSAKFPGAKQLKLNSGQITQNKILEKGFLLEIFEFGEDKVYGQCLGVQDIDLYSKIEYKKPYTDKRMGVLPAKLARILVNLSGVKEGQTIWDPFCGSGTTLLEAFLMQVNVIGSDFNPRAVAMAKTNIEWLGKELGNDQTLYKTFRFDVLKPDTRVISLLRNTPLSAVVCEPFMGRPQLHTSSVTEAKKNLQTVKELYSSLFAILEHIRLTQFKIVLIIPSYKTKMGWITLSLSDIVSKKWIVENKKYGGDLHWMRENSIIRRNIFILRKKN